MQSGVGVLCNQAQQMREMLRDAALGRGKVLYSGLRHSSSEHTAKASLLWLGGVKLVYLLSFSEEELCGSHPLKKMHESMAARARP
jgi:hypothetical protein